MVDMDIGRDKSPDTVKGKFNGQSGGARPKIRRDLCALEQPVTNQQAVIAVYEQFMTGARDAVRYAVMHGYKGMTLG